MTNESLSIKWEFEKDCREKKNIGHSAAKRVGQRKGCKLPSDFMTIKEKNELNGEVISMNVNKPMTYSEFQALSNEMQSEYLQNLINNHGGTIVKIAGMFKINPNTFRSYCHRNFKLATTNGGPSKENFGKWAKFMAGTGIENTKKAPESHENAPETTKVVEEGNETVRVIGPSQDELEAQAPAVEEWMDKPMRYADFRMRNKYQQEAYINRLIHRYDGSLKRIAAMFNIPKKTLISFLEKKTIEVDPKEFENNRKPEDKWLCFCEGIPYEKKEVKDERIEINEPVAIVPPAVQVAETVEIQKPQISTAKISFKMKDLSSLTEIIDFLKNVGLPMNGTVTFELNA